MKPFFFLLLILKHLFSITYSWDVSLAFERQASKAVGGEAFETQPKIIVFDKKKTKQFIDIEGHLVATLSSSWKSERLGVIRDGACDSHKREHGVSVPVINGSAEFVDLCINRSGAYVIHFELFDEYGILLAQIDHETFQVLKGNPFQIGIIQLPKNVLGGVVWSVNPIVAVQDKGYNTIDSICHGNVSIAIANKHPEDILRFKVLYQVVYEELYQIISPKTILWSNGTAEFKGLSIDIASSGYQLNFTTDLDLSGPRVIISDEISVLIGPPKSLIEVEGPHLSQVTGGKAFTNQPILHVVDDGGNIVSQNRSMLVSASLYSNPTNTSLRPFNSAWTSVENGVAIFRDLFINKAGDRYSLRYTLWILEQDGMYHRNNITTFGKFFNVTVGKAQALKLLKGSSETWAGNQPFEDQPKVALVDSGGNVLHHVSDLRLHAYVVPSLSQTSYIVVDTRSDPVPSIEAVHYHESILLDHKTHYSSGHKIAIEVKFTSEIVLQPGTNGEGNWVLPSLTLRPLNRYGHHSKAFLSDNEEPVPTSKLLFTYVVDVNDTQSFTISQDILQISSNDYLILDLWGRNASLAVPEFHVNSTLIESKVIILHNQKAAIRSIEALTRDGKYGSGEAINFEVNFSHEVTTNGSPELQINVQSLVAIIESTGLGTSFSKSYFYIWYNHERSASIPWDASAAFLKSAIEKIPSVIGQVCVSRSSTASNFGFIWFVRFDSIYDDFRKGFEVEPAAVSLDHESSHFSVSFELMFYSTDGFEGNSDRHHNYCLYRSAKYLNGAGTKTLRFRYDVLPGDTSDNLRLLPNPFDKSISPVNTITNALNDAEASLITADLSDFQISNLTWSISIDTTSPQIIDIFVSTNNSIGDVLHAGDEILFTFQFDQHVAISGIPSIPLDVRPYGKAIYSFHSGELVVFSYVVRKDTWSHNIFNQHATERISLEEGAIIRRSSTSPVTDAILTIPWSDIDLNPLSVDGRTPLVKSIEILNSTSNVVLGSGDTVRIQVRFTTSVVIFKGPPVLIVSAGGEVSEALYEYGNMTSTLVFSYNIKTGDSSKSSMKCHLICVSTGCFYGASTEGYVMQMSSNPEVHASLSLPFIGAESDHNILLNHKFLIDTSSTLPPRILKVTTTTIQNVVSFGEVIRFELKFSDAVYCYGSTLPKLSLNIMSKAVYESGNATNSLIFKLLVQETDEIDQLQLLSLPSTNSAVICDGGRTRPCHILNGNRISADLSFLEIPDIEQKISINGTKPSIIASYIDTTNSISCSNDNCTFVVGDLIKVFVKYDVPVSVRGYPRVQLSIINKAGKFVHANFYKEFSNETDLYFHHKIEYGDYMIENLLPIYILNIDLQNADYYIRRMSTIPITDALIDLEDKPLLVHHEKPIYFNAFSNPKVIEVRHINTTGTYSPGDKLVFQIVFDSNVVVHGTPILMLDVRDSDQGIAYYSGTPNVTTDRINFEYFVGKNHCTTLLDYSTRHSLILMNGSSIVKASMMPTLAVNTTLPDPSSKGSLSSHRQVSLDCSYPYIEKIWSPISPSTVQANEKVPILVKFSRAIQVKGIPRLKLETGTIDRFAVFRNMTDDSTLLFEYTVVSGDYSERLDYWTYEGIGRSSNASFDLSHASIMLRASEPLIHADVHLNPSQGHLSGEKDIPILEGDAEYFDLKIGKAGADYKIRYSLPIHDSISFKLYSNISVSESSEFQILSDDKDRNKGDMFGYSTSIYRDILAVGAPRKRVASAEVQRLTIMSRTSTDQDEIQIFGTSLNISEGLLQVQSFRTFCSNNSTIRGSIRIRYINALRYLFGSHFTVSADADDSFLRNKIMEKLPFLGVVKVSRRKNDDCYCTNAWEWRISFTEMPFQIQTLDIDGSLLVGELAGISTVDFEKNLTLLAGSFILQNPLTKSISRPIPFDASNNFVHVTIEEDLGVKVKRVESYNEHDGNIPEYGRRWIVTFSHFEHNSTALKNVPNLNVRYDNLTGSESYMWTHVASEGKSVLAGFFAVSMRESNYSDYVPFNSSESELKNALESIESINKVSITSREIIEDDHGILGYSWTIIFHSVNINTIYGWMPDPDVFSGTGNLPSLVVKSRLIGWNTYINVDYENGSGPLDTQSQWDQKSKGDYGYGRGEVGVFAYELGSWKMEARLRASDGDAQDNFGHSVSLGSGILAVGAPSKEVNGIFEKQVLECQGTPIDGSFRVKFRGGESKAIPFNASLSEIYFAMKGTYGTVNNIHALPSFRLEWSDGSDDVSARFCSENRRSIIITFFSPDGGGMSTFSKTIDGNIENLIVDNSDLLGGDIHVDFKQNGTRRLSGENSLGVQSGAVYTFHRFSSCSSCSYWWVESNKLTPLNAGDSPTGTDRFGWSLATHEDILLIGSPGWNGQTGKVYIYQLDQNFWIYHQSLTPDSWDVDMRGANFGHSISISGDTVVVGAPGYRSHEGSVLIYRRTEGYFLASQMIHSPDTPSEQEFGHSISLYNNTIVICSPYQKVKMNGACHVYDRHNILADFKLSQELIPSNVKADDRFGWSVSLWNDRILVGQVQDYIGKDNINSPEQVLITGCKGFNYREYIGGHFRITLRNDAVDTTRLLPYSISAKGLKKALEEDLNTGFVHVTRSELPDSCGGFIWKITLLSHEYIRHPTANVAPLLSCDSSYLIGPNPFCRVELKENMAPQVRAKVHLFALKNSVWTEQAFLFPQEPQPQDLVGYSVSLYESTALLGAPNRHVHNINSGAAIVQDVSYTDVQFEKPLYTVKEGDKVQIHIQRPRLDKEITLGYQTIDINSSDRYQNYVRALWGYGHSETVKETAIQRLTGNRATGRNSQNELWQSSNWRQGLFDYRGLSDYETVNMLHKFQEVSFSHTVEIETYEDPVLEGPDEKLTLQISLPGMYASSLGHLKTDIVIEDDGDGSVGDSNYYSKILRNDTAILFHEGAPVHTLVSERLSLVGDPTFSYFDDLNAWCERCGRVGLYLLKGNRWELIRQLMQPSAKSHAFFGSSVLMMRGITHSNITLLVGSPGVISLFLFEFDLNTQEIKFKQSLSPFEINDIDPEHGYGSHNTIDMSQNIICASAPKLETVFVYRRISAEWASWKILRANDYDYDLYGMNFTIHHVHQQHFGHAVKVYGRRILISAPYADYGNRGEISQRESHDTDGLYNVGLGRGKLYLFYSQPHVTKISWSFTSKPRNGSFKLRIFGDKETKPFHINFSSFQMEKELRTIGLKSSVNIEISEIEGFYFICIRITFDEIFEDDPPAVEVLWSLMLCSDCEIFRDYDLMPIQPNLLVQAESMMIPHVLNSTIQSRNSNGGDGFGFSIDMSQDHIVVGAPFSSAQTRTTWDFETGDLIGWVTTGSAFDFQPTFGDNSYRRTLYRDIDRRPNIGLGDPQSAAIQGRYYIGTNERRMTSSGSGGGIQGDVLIGTMTSEPFMIQEGYISFLIGGGCNDLTIYIELLVDGFPSMKSTGSCHERMERKAWNVSQYKGRSGQMRIVDLDQGLWGHINIDDIRFSWIENSFADYSISTGGSVKATTSSINNGHSKQEQTAKAGAVYVFERVCRNSSCEWNEVQRLIASDKRENNLFGFSVAINSLFEMILVGSPSSPVYGFCRNEKLKYQSSEHMFNDFVDRQLDKLKVERKSIMFNQLNQEVHLKETITSESYGDNAGSVYIFLRRQNRPQGMEWMVSEDARFAPPDLVGEERFGRFMAHSGSMAIFGTSSKTSYAYLFDLKWYSVRFKKKEFTVLEGMNDDVQIHVSRNIKLYSGEVSVGYSTSDSTASGVSSSRFDTCMSLILNDRSSCGDYEHTSGIITFNDGQEETWFRIRIMNDAESEQRVKYVLLSMHIPGGSVVHGENFRARLRIDDDDW